MYVFWGLFTNKLYYYFYYLLILKKIMMLQGKHMVVLGCLISSFLFILLANVLLSSVEVL